MVNIKTFIFLILFKIIHNLTTEDYVFKRDDMFENTNYLVNLDKTIVDRIQKPNATIIQLVKSFKNYIEYMVEKIQMRSQKEMKFCASLWTKLSSGPLFFKSEIDFNLIKEKCSWTEREINDFRRLLDKVERVWLKFTVFSLKRKLCKD